MTASPELSMAFSYFSLLSYSPSSQISVSRLRLLLEFQAFHHWNISWTFSLILHTHPKPKSVYLFDSLISVLSMTQPIVPIMGAKNTGLIFDILSSLVAPKTHTSYWIRRVWSCMLIFLLNIFQRYFFLSSSTARSLAQIFLSLVCHFNGSQTGLLNSCTSPFLSFVCPAAKLVLLKCNSYCILPLLKSFEWSLRFLLN